MDAIVLAGGFGTRLRPLINDRPKILAPVNGIPFLEIFLNHWMKKGVTRFFISTGYMHEQVLDFINYSPFRNNVFLIKEESPLGTGGGVLHVLQEIKIKEPFLITNGDTIFDFNLTEFCHDHESSGADLSLAVRKIADTERYGKVELDGEKNIISFHSSRSSGEGLIYGGTLICAGASLLLQDFHSPCSLEMDIIPKLIAKKIKIKGIIYSGTFIDIGTPESFDEAQTLLKED